MKTSPIMEELRAEGRLEALRTLVIRQGRKKFGKSATRKQQQEVISMTDVGRLESLVDRLFDVNSWTDLLNGH